MTSTGSKFGVSTPRGGAGRGVSVGEEPITATAPVGKEAQCIERG